MNPNRRFRKFKMVEIGAFDARRGGLKRCHPGIAYTPDPVPWSPYKPTTSVADFWRDPDGVICIRFTSGQPYVYQFMATLVNGKPILGKDLEDFDEYISGMLVDWDGIDIPPDTEYYI